MMGIILGDFVVSGRYHYHLSQNCISATPYLQNRKHGQVRIKYKLINISCSCNFRQAGSNVPGTDFRALRSRSGNSRFPGREIRILGCEKCLVQMNKWKQESGNKICFERIVSYAGRRTDFWDKKSSDFSGEIFRERNFGRSIITAPTTLFPLIGCGVDSFSPN